ncbi:MAG: D-alanyl-D-alanine carboxypeptidase/D-alanyl-D-alanine-endopeptidase [Candidatus Sumerlaeaceae bacterium]|nr:D-alanyl-D-alanine carboxypeptidase/D-alanyl-D-alanine-endopeptidase [Candidatus Sumerlaeaceae bacterium]
MSVKGLEMRVPSWAVLLLVVTVWTQLAAAGDVERAALTKQLDQLFDAPAWRNAQWGVMILDLDTSEVLYQRQADKAFMPASNLKLYTTAVALKTLGNNYRFETKIYINGPIQKNGTLGGDIIVVGSGDPSISGRYNPDLPTTGILRQWANAIRAAGIRRIEGAIIGDDDCFDDRPRAGTWQLDYYQEWYAAESSGLAINENCWDVTLTPAKAIGEKARLHVLLPTKYVTFRNEVVTTAPTGQPEADLDIEIQRPLDNNIVTLRGAIPADHAPYKLWGSVHNGTLWSVTLLREELERQGVRVSGGALDIDSLPDKQKRLRRDTWRLIYTHVSPPLWQLVAIVNKPSQNFYADQLLKTLGFVKYGQGSFEGGERVVREFLGSAGIDTTSLRMADGSGLSRQNLVDPQMTVRLLAFMAWQPEGKAFYESLPIAGVDGTLRKRMKGTPAEGKVHAKTGYIGRVRCLSGYATTRDRHPVAFSMMVNNYTVDTKLANDTQDSATLLLMQFSEGPKSIADDEPVTATASPVITKTDYTMEQSARALRGDSDPGGLEVFRENP